MSQPNFSSIFGFEKFHSKSENTSFSRVVGVKLLYSFLPNKIAAKCSTYIEILNGFVDNQNVERSFIFHSCNIQSKKQKSKTDERILATKNFATCGEPLDMVCLVNVKSLKKWLSLSTSCEIDA